MLNTLTKRYFQGGPKTVTFGKKDQKKWHFEWPNQNSKTTFIVQTFPKYGPYDILFREFITFGRDFGHFSILWIFGLILAIFLL